eukprot:GHVU01022397.1.p1 GENE.GHVU01022397.1~~GHVU01022397.1.p1  ORF type:complete len:443 (-),score=87.88 GHVU01022397.1:188-1516(-)
MKALIPPACPGCRVTAVEFSCGGVVLVAHAAPTAAPPPPPPPVAAPVEGGGDAASSDDGGRGGGAGEVESGGEGDEFLRAFAVPSAREPSSSSSSSRSAPPPPAGARLLFVRRFPGGRDDRGAGEGDRRGAPRETQPRIRGLVAAPLCSHKHGPLKPVTVAVTFRDHSVLVMTLLHAEAHRRGGSGESGGYAYAAAHGGGGAGDGLYSTLTKMPIVLLIIIAVVSVFYSTGTKWKSGDAAGGRRLRFDPPTSPQWNRRQRSSPYDGGPNENVHPTTDPRLLAHLLRHQQLRRGSEEARDVTGQPDRHHGHVRSLGDRGEDGDYGGSHPGTGRTRERRRSSSPTHGFPPDAARPHSARAHNNSVDIGDVITKSGKYRQMVNEAMRGGTGSGSRGGPSVSAATAADNVATDALAAAGGPRYRGAGRAATGEGEADDARERWDGR